jgi:hypothetical protein
MIEGVVAVTGTARGTACAAIGLSLYEGWRPEDINIAVGTADRLVLTARQSFAIVALELIALCLHIPLPSSAFEYYPFNFSTYKCAIRCVRTA